MSTFMVDPVPIFLTPSLIIMQNFVVNSRNVCTHTMFQKFGERWALLH